MTVRKYFILASVFLQGRGEGGRCKQIDVSYYFYFILFKITNDFHTFLDIIALIFCFNVLINQVAYKAVLVHNFTRVFVVMDTHLRHLLTQPPLIKH